MSEDRLNQTYACITLRKAEVLERLVNFRKLKDIATDLCLSIHTIRDYVQELEGLVGVSDVRDLALWWLHHRDAWERYQIEQIRRVLCRAEVRNTRPEGGTT